jgi:hypothetical protein
VKVAEEVIVRKCAEEVTGVTLDMLGGWMLLCKDMLLVVYTVPSLRVWHGGTMDVATFM